MPDPSALRPLAVPVLRAFVGLDLVVLAVNNKLLNPRVSMELVRSRSLNFLGCSDELFVLHAAFVELALGLLLLLDIVPRLAAAAFASLLVVTFFVFGAVEALGHLPILAALFAIVTGIPAAREARPRPASSSPSTLLKGVPCP